MRIPKSIGLFLSGTLGGLALALCVAATGKPEASPKPDWSRLKMVSYPSGATGFFDPDNGRLYLYDGNLRNCYQIRELRALGDPMNFIRN